MSKYLISYEYYLRDDCGNRYSTDTKSLIKRLIERVYDNEVESAYISNFEDYYVKNSVLSVTVIVIPLKVGKRLIVKFQRSARRWILLFTLPLCAPEAKR